MKHNAKYINHILVFITTVPIIVTPTHKHLYRVTSNLMRSPSVTECITRGKSVVKISYIKEMNVKLDTNV